MTDVRVLILLGSLRAASVNRLLAQAAVAAAPPGVVPTFAEGLADLPHYDQDLDGDARPAAVHRFVAQVAAADVVLVVTPEYNGTMSSVVKNAIDWASRPSRRGPLAELPAAAIGATFGRHGGVWSQREARRALGIAGALVLEEPTVSVGDAHARFARTPPAEDLELMHRLSELLTALCRAALSRRAAPAGGVDCPPAAT